MSEIVLFDHESTNQNMQISGLILQLIGICDTYVAEGKAIIALSHGSQKPCYYCK